MLHIFAYIIYDIQYVSCICLSMLLFESMLINCESEIQKVDYFINVNTGILDGTF